MNHSPTPPMVPVPWRPERKMRGRLMLGKSVVRDAGGLGSGRSSGGLIASVKEAPAVPRKGEYINIGNGTWRVVDVTWAIDNQGDSLRANIEIDEVTWREKQYR